MGIIKTNGQLENTDPTIIIDDNKGRPFFQFMKSGTEVAHCNKDGELISTSGYGTKTVHVGIGDVAANSDAVSYPVFVSNVPVVITEIELTIDTTLAADASHYQTLAFTESGGNNLYATAATTAGGIASGTWLAGGTTMLTSTYAKLNAGEYVKLVFTKTGNGGAMSGVTIRIEYNIQETGGTPTQLSVTEASKTRVIDAQQHGETDGVLSSDQTVRAHMDLRKSGKSVFRVDLDGRVIQSDNARDKYDMVIVNCQDIDGSEDDAKISCLLHAIGRIKIHNIYVASNNTNAADSDSAYETVSLKKDTAFICTFEYGGPQATGLAMTKGVFYEIGSYTDGTLVRENAILENTDDLRVSYTTTSTGADADGLTFAIAIERLD